MKKQGLSWCAGWMVVLAVTAAMSASGNATTKRRTAPPLPAPRERLRALATKQRPPPRTSVAGRASASAGHTAPPEWIRQIGSSSYEQATGLAASFGTLYTVGYTSGAPGSEPGLGGFDFFLAKHDASGRLEWFHQAGTSVNDYATGIAIHDVNSPAVSVYITGYTSAALDGNTNAGGQDLFVIKYDAQGARQWTRQLGSGLNDFAQGVATDPQGNVYVTGYTPGGLDGNTSAGGQDLFLVKYDAQGARQWTRQFGSSKNDQARGVAADADGNVYVTGFTSGALAGATSAGDQDLFLIKFTAQGDRQWVRQLGTARKDVAQAVATSRRGTGEVEIYVAGRTEGSAQGTGLDGAPQRGSYDIVVAKYDASGTLKWVRQAGTAGEDSASAITSDGAGQVYVTGSVPVDLESGASLGGNDIVVLKYDAAGTLLASRQLGSVNAAQPTRTSDWGMAVAADRENGLYVAGYAEGGFSGAAGAGDKDLVLMKYAEGCGVTAPGQCGRGYGWGEVSLWGRQFGTPSDEYSDGVAMSCDGSVYVAGHTAEQFEGLPYAGGLDLLVVKYNPSGNRLWARQAGSSGDEYVMGAASDASGAVYVVGTTSGALDGQASAGDYDLFVMKFDAAGTKQWTRQMGTREFDQATSVATDSAGNVYVAGVTYGGLDGNTNAGGFQGDAFLVRFNAAGQKQWTRQFGTTALDQADGVATDSAGNVYLAGITQGVLPGNSAVGDQDLLVAKYSVEGERLWLRQLGTADFDAAGGSATDPLGNTYVSAYTLGTVAGQSSAGGTDLLVMKVGSGGDTVWSRQLGTSGDENAGGATLDLAGNLYVAGSTTGTWEGNTSAGDLDMTLVKLKPDGTREWIRQLGTDAAEHAEDVGVDARGNVAIAGATFGTYGGQAPLGGLDILVLRLGLVECGSQCGAGCP